MSASTLTERQQWLEEGRAKGALFMLIVCDTFDFSDYPVYVFCDEDPREKAENLGEMLKLMECFCLVYDFRGQQRPGVGLTLNFDAPPLTHLSPHPDFFLGQWPPYLLRTRAEVGAGA